MAKRRHTEDGQKKANRRWLKDSRQKAAKSRQSQERKQTKERRRQTKEGGQKKEGRQKKEYPCWTAAS